MRAELACRQEISVSLVLLNGPDPGTVLPLSPTRECTLGRDGQCELHLDDPLASRFHARIWHEGDTWRIEDCDSRNGTYVNSRAIQRSLLRPGDLIRIGQRMVVFSCEEPRNQDVSPSCLADNTRVRRIFAAERKQMIESPLSSATRAAPLKLAHLFRLSKDLHGVGDLESLVSRVVAALREGIGAEAAKVCLRGVDGRLMVFGADLDAEREAPQFLANWIIERDEALLIELNENPVRSGDQDAVEQGTAIGAPVPGRPRPRGAVECFHLCRQRQFELADLEFVIAVAQLLGVALENLEHRERIEQSNRDLRSRLSQAHSPMLGHSPAVRRLQEQISRVACTGSTVLVIGESGTGKELVARTIHDLSDREAGPFVAVNCAAFSDSLLESELFGHEKGAFTGADARRKGQFERAHRGTIFLDEVGELSARCQAKLLRLLEGQPFERLGGIAPIQVDVRIVAATHRNLRDMVQQRQFREDLWYRLRVIELRTPPLRERDEDVVLLAAHFLDEFRGELGRGPSRFSPEAVESLRKYQWPGNVREVRNAVERAVVLGAGEEISPADLGLIAPAEASTGSLASLSDAEQRHIEQVLAAVGGNKTEACKILGIGRATLYNKLNRQQVRR